MLQQMIQTRMIVVNVNRFPVQWPCDVIDSKPMRISSPPVLFSNVVEYQLAWDGVT
jgi:hypothetical protein